MAKGPVDSIGKTDTAQRGGAPHLCQRKAHVGHLRMGMVLLAVLAAVLLAGCREDMHNQPKFIPLRENTFYPDLRSARTLIPGTVARGQYEDDDPLLYTGKIDGKEADQFPFPITAADLQRGRERFNIYCSPCHSQLGDGNGMIVQRGFKRPPSYMDPRLLKAPVGHFFNVMSNGWGSMADYAAQVPVADRWRIAAYIRALQLAQTAKPSDLLPGQKAAMAAPGGQGSTTSKEMSMAQPAASVGEAGKQPEAK